MFAKILAYAEAVNRARIIAGMLPRRNVVRLTSEEWNELVIDPVFALVHDPRYQHVIIHDVVFRCDQPARMPAATSDTTGHSDTSHD